MNNNQLIENYKTFKLNSIYTVKQTEEYNAVFMEGNPISVLKRYDMNIYNEIFDFIPKENSIIMKKDKIEINFIIKSEKNEDYDLKGFYVSIGYNNYNFKKSSNGIYHVEIPYNSINIPGKSTGIFLTFEDKYGFKFEKRFISKKWPHKEKNRDIYTSKLCNFNNHSIYIYETWGGYLSLTYREINITDSSLEQKKIKLAFLKHKLDYKLNKNTPSILLYEKFCRKYEESAKYIYQKLIDEGYKNVYFILDKDSEYYKEVPKKYRSNIINKNSFKHYYEYFNAKAFISTESFFHAIETTNYNSLVRKRQMWENYYYFFLQHGVMYGYSLKGRTAFNKGSGFRNNSFIVISSEKEGENFIENGKFDREDLIKSGLPKFDYATQNENADKILIMPTTRNFEYSTIRDDSENSTYYKFSKKIIESVPNDLKDKILFIPHPLLMKMFEKTDLKEYIPNEYNYNELLKNTRLLITDYSSISFDAFYRGCNVIFAWIEKEMCLENLGWDLMLNDDNAFADIAYDYKTLRKLINENYYGTHSKENTEKYRKIVEFYDGKNTERFIECLYNTNLFPNKAKKVNINNVNISGIKDCPYNGKGRTLTKLKLNYNGQKLIKNLDYSVKYYNNKEIGSATAEIKGKGIYFGTIKINFKIKKDISKCEFKIDEDELNIIDNEELSKDKDYTLEIVDYPKLDIKRIIIKGIGKYTGEKSILINTL